MPATGIPDCWRSSCNRELTKKANEYNRQAMSDAGLTAAE